MTFMRLALLAPTSSRVDYLQRVLGAAGYRCHAFPPLSSLALDPSSPFASLRPSLRRSPAPPVEPSVSAMLSDTFDCMIVAGDPHDPRLRATLHTLQQRATPIVAIVSPATDADIIATLDAGADDCISEPCHPGILVARVRSVLRRAAQTPPLARTLSVFGPYCFDPARHLVTFDGKTQALTPKEMTLALLLFRHVGRELSRRYLIEGVWMRESPSTSRSLDTHISRIRRKLELTTDNGYQLAAIYSHGYRLDRFAYQTSSKHFTGGRCAADVAVTALGALPSLLPSL